MSFVVALLLVSADVAVDPQPAAPAPQAAAVPAPKKAKEKRICKADADADPASHMVRRICHTEQEWKQPGVLGSSRSGFSVSGDKMDGH